MFIFDSNRKLLYVTEEELREPCNTIEMWRMTKHRFILIELPRCFSPWTVHSKKRGL